MVELTIDNWAGAEGSAYDVYLNSVNKKTRVETRIGSASVKQIKTMRSTGEHRTQEKPMDVKMSEMLSATFAAFMACFRLNKKPNNAMCKHYGHRIDKTWKGLFPKCVDCDATVRDPKSLRRSSVY